MYLSMSNTTAPLTDDQKKVLDAAVKKTLKKYRKTLQKLALT
jgi:ferric iron reductase protein FhuF